MASRAIAASSIRSHFDTMYGHYFDRVIRPGRKKPCKSSLTATYPCSNGATTANGNGTGACEIARSYYVGCIVGNRRSSYAFRCRHRFAFTRARDGSIVPTSKFITYWVSLYRELRGRKDTATYHLMWFDILVSHFTKNAGIGRLRSYLVGNPQLCGFGTASSQRFARARVSLDHLETQSARLAPEADVELVLAEAEVAHG